ncbi:glycoside hydrolase family 16 protein [Heterobasidion irregulare TC 32-1]|uniref:Glycoside hydrolase family 16 protein n=1 Tax=Heterobasidion irregulare (strain TC 32-1) TaxID=747525 RepID=W4JP90_HETIT|nr:glycoside hydrolase family 16 protein [Heterobasidion irregulare TC 32-1]ETW74900.1 glycoside hydrolase family 16 protein [Heterobasidion irregulare TC 32-1]
MYHKLPPVWSFFLLATTARASAILDFSNAMFNDRTLSSSRLGSWPQGTYSGRHVTKRHNDVLASTSTNSSNSTTDHVWIIQDTFDSTNFFDHFSFYNESDPTHGTVDYVDRDTAIAHGLAYVTNDSQVIMKGDDTNWLASGQYRESVRVSSYAQYNTGLFILDIDRAPWGCGVWPAFWTLGSGTWPETGEIDIIEGVHDNEHNQVTWHTNPGCTLTPTANFTGSIVASSNGQPNLNCQGGSGDTFPGCGITEWSRASYGPTFDSQGGGVFAMKWDQDGIAVWGFYRVAVPQDVKDGSPNPANWGTPVAMLAPDNCDPLTYFVNHSIIFDITFCGDWAGNSYATSGCPGTCSDRIMDPGNFVNASWIINSLKVYRRQNITSRSSSRAVHTSVGPMTTVMLGLIALISLVHLVHGWM